MGFENGGTGDEINVGIIFITANDQYAAKAFRLNKVARILKPLAISTNDYQYYPMTTTECRYIKLTGMKGMATYTL